MGCRGHFGPQAQFSGWNTAIAQFEENHIIPKKNAKFKETKQ